MSTLSDQYHNPAGVKALAIIADLPLHEAICMWEPAGLHCDPGYIESWLRFHLVHEVEEGGIDRVSQQLILNWLLWYVDFKAAAEDMATYINLPSK